MSSRAKQSYVIQSVKNALCILEAIGDAKGEARVMQLSAQLGMNKAKVFRLLATFETLGYVEQAASGGYRLGLAAYAMGQKLLAGMELLQEARPVMQALARELDEAIYLAVPRGREVLLLDMVNTSQRVAIIPLLGHCWRLSEAAVGQVILAFQSRPQSAAAGPGESELARIRARGAGWDSNRLGEGIASLAVPLQSGSGVCGALCLVAPEFRVSEQRRDNCLLPPLRAAGETISARLGHLSPALRTSAAY